MDIEQELAAIERRLKEVQHDLENFQGTVGDAFYKSKESLLQQLSATKVGLQKTYQRQQLKWAISGELWTMIIDGKKQLSANRNHFIDTINQLRLIQKNLIESYESETSKLIQQHLKKYTSEIYDAEGQHSKLWYSCDKKGIF
ncbi:hypothetical protein A374_01214 [Fictibacillus macauensis ZFHKF-1]|uniref:Uncharacterized protein n=1 Tax=Fictibacillus macauensis ZFHKF-1 TaxID=1196324 RepID=I8UK48_9BACL|nr:hypothetical protein [Fictibacillus macauensis]EIT87260.1 hypothetical protein A374_01214 [Fictibacillus macauensis ZFHKF-1]